MPHASLRLFFALPCPPHLATAISAWRAQLQLPGHAVPTANLHLTLAFLGEQPTANTEQLLAMAAALPSSAFTLHLDRLARFRGGLLHLAPSQTPAQLLELVEALRLALLGLDIQLETRPFQAHLSLIRHCPICPESTSPSFDWPVTQFALFASESGPDGPRYRALRCWSLGGNDQA